IGARARIGRFNFTQKLFSIDPGRLSNRMFDVKASATAGTAEARGFSCFKITLLSSSALARPSSLPSVPSAKLVLRKLDPALLPEEPQESAHHDEYDADNCPETVR